MTAGMKMLTELDWVIVLAVCGCVYCVCVCVCVYCVCEGVNCVFRLKQVELLSHFGSEHFCPLSLIR